MANALLLSACGRVIKPLQANIMDNNINVSTIKNIDAEKDIMLTDSIYFDFNSYKIMKKEYKENLSLLKRYLDNKDKMNPNEKINITLTGYCDEIGTNEYNYDLGVKRAEEVKNYLVTLGVDEMRITIKSYGKQHQETEAEKIREAREAGEAKEVGEQKEEERRLNRKVVIGLNNAK
jgi:outer membrane protein OmpA-like peptidoglycan-associated protein